MCQRSADMGIGVPFNIALLTRLIAHCCGLECGELIHVMGDYNIYLNHEKALREQLKREPYEFPKLKINTCSMDIDDFHLELVNYVSHKPIKMNMSI